MYMQCYVLSVSDTFTLMQGNPSLMHMQMRKTSKDYALAGV